MAERKVADGVQEAAFCPDGQSHTLVGSEAAHRCSNCGWSNDPASSSLDNGAERNRWHRRQQEMKGLGVFWS